MSKPTFSFGTPGTGGSSGTFGQPSNSNQPGLFSNTAGNNTTGGATPQQSSPFGAPTQSTAAPNLFGSLSSTAGAQKPLNFRSNTAPTSSSGTTAPSLFSTSTGNASGSMLFGGGANTSGASNPFGGPGFAFGKKTEEKNDSSNTTASGFPTGDKVETPSQAPSGPLFGGLGATSAPVAFGAATPSSSAPVGSTTPSTSKPGGIFGFANSTTPAGPPPADSDAANKPNPFGSTQSSSGGLFGNVKQSDTATKPAAAQPNSLFGASVTGGVTSSNTWPANISTPASAPNLFGGSNAAKPTTTESSAPSTSSAAPSKSPFSFTSSATVSSPLAATQAPNPFAAASSSSSTPAIRAQAVAPSLFGNLKPSTPSSSDSTQTSSLFANLGKSNPSTSSASSSAPTTTTSAPAPSLFGPKTTQPTNGTPPAIPTVEKESTAATAPAAASGLGASISNPLAVSSVGPAPQLSRLKNKTMDEIITRWATDLSTYQKDFQNQAAKVASWDRLLVENGDKIQKLYNSTFEAERAGAEVERQLASVESQQDELTAWLDHYEREVDDMFVKHVGYGESLQGPDQERERTYKLAEKLTDRLDEMGRDLTSMIQEINTASATLTKTNKPDDPLSQIVRVLNGHLSQLQWIDQNAASLQAKIAAAQKAGQSIGSDGYGNTENDPADEFYRSYMGRR